MHDEREGWYEIVLGIDVDALLDQLVAQSFELGLDRVHQDSPPLHTATPCQPVKLHVPERRMRGTRVTRGSLTSCRSPESSKKQPPKITSECYASLSDA